MDPIAPGIRGGSDTGHLSILGYDPLVHYTGRGPFETGIVRWAFDVGLGDRAAIVKMMGEALDRAREAEMTGYDQPTVDAIKAQLPRIVSVGLAPAP